jgi:hypothetical protein
VHGRSIYMLKVTCCWFVGFADTIVCGTDGHGKIELREREAAAATRGSLGSFAPLSLQISSTGIYLIAYQSDEV